MLAQLHLVSVHMPLDLVETVLACVYHVLAKASNPAGSTSIDSQTISVGLSIPELDIVWHTLNSLIVSLHHLP